MRELGGHSLSSVETPLLKVTMEPTSIDTASKFMEEYAGLLLSIKSTDGPLTRHLS
jgi:hypothetical protein